jgi:hypothetical protein
MAEGEPWRTREQMAEVAKEHLAACCALVGAQQRLLWARTVLAYATPSSFASSGPCAAPGGSGGVRVGRVREGVAAALTAAPRGASASAKVTSRALPSDPFFQRKKHKPSKTQRRAHQKQKRKQQVGPEKGALKRKAAPGGGACVDTPLLLEDFRTPVPQALAELLSECWGGAHSERYVDYCRLLSVPPAYTCLRVNTLLCPDVEQAVCQLDTALAPLRAAHLRGGGGGGGGEGGIWPVQRHPVLRDVLLVPSVPSTAAAAVAPSEAPEAASALAPPSSSSSSSSGSGGEGEGRARHQVVVGRLCGEAVLRGADVFCKGVLSASATVQAGSMVRALY